MAVWADEHDRITDAVAAGDADMAEHLTRTHIAAYPPVGPRQRCGSRSLTSIRKIQQPRGLLMQPCRYVLLRAAGVEKLADDLSERLARHRISHLAGSPERRAVGADRTDPAEQHVDVPVETPSGRRTCRAVLAHGPSARRTAGPAACGASTTKLEMVHEQASRRPAARAGPRTPARRPITRLIAVTAWMASWCSLIEPMMSCASGRAHLTRLKTSSPASRAHVHRTRRT